MGYGVDSTPFTWSIGIGDGSVGPLPAATADSLGTIVRDLTASDFKKRGILVLGTDFTQLVLVLQSLQNTSTNSGETWRNHPPELAAFEAYYLPLELTYYL